MKIHVLGYWGAYPEPGEATTGFLLEDGSTKVLIDCGSGVLSQMLKVTSMADLTAVVITHHHHDHVADLGTLGYALLLARITGMRDHPLPIYMPAGNPTLESEFAAEPYADVHLIDENSRVLIGDGTWTFVRTEHAVYCLAVRVEAGGKTFVFSSDSSICQPLEALAKEADLFLCEASMYEGQEDVAKQTGHLTSKQAGLLAKRAGVKQLAITHYPHYGDLQQLAREVSTAYGQPVLTLTTLKTIEF